MEVAIGTIINDEGPDPLELARAAEHHGFGAIFCPDHTHVPVNRETPFPQPPWEMPRAYYRTLDPLVTLSAIAAVTSELKLGTGVCLVVERDPIVLAKEVATLDHLSGGRVLLGVGAGWNREEMSNHGTDPRTRMALMRERVAAMKLIWTQEQAEYHGRYVDFDPIFSWPKPAQAPGPPVIVGGNGPTVLDRVLDYGDGWIPGHQRDLGALGARIGELQGRAAAAGRRRIPVSLIFAQVDSLERYRELEIDRAIFMLPSAPTAAVLGELDELAGRLTAEGLLGSSVYAERLDVP